MTYIHELPGWPNLTWELGDLANDLASVRSRQGLLLGKMQALGFGERLEASASSLTGEVVKTSAIEGVVLDPAEVRSSLAKRLGLDATGLPPAGRDVEGTVEMVLDATQNYSQPLTSERLFGWHASLFPTGRSGMHTITVGRWRTAEHGPMQVVSGPVGRERVHFEAPTADRVEREMQEFLNWFNAIQGLDHVLVSGVAHFWFVTIHPFDDGNGRIARAIADMALSRADGTGDRFYSMSAQIARERDDYYKELEVSQRGDLNITRWLSWYLRCLSRAIDAAEATVSRVLDQAKIWRRANAFALNDRQQNILRRLMNDFEGHLTTSKYAKIAKCSTDTALRDIRELVAWGVLIQNPQRGRSTNYRLPEPNELE